MELSVLTQVFLVHKIILFVFQQLVTLQLVFVNLTLSLVLMMPLIYVILLLVMMWQVVLIQPSVVLLRQTCVLSQLDVTLSLEVAEQEISTVMMEFSVLWIVVILPLDV
jgi:hypothetical protein